MLRDRMNKILITGGSGLLAVNLAQIIRNQYTVTLGLHSRSIQLKSTKSLKINLESTNSVLEAIDNVQPQLVIHTVGLVNVEYCEQHSDIAKHINVELTKNVAQACKSRNVQMIYISTDHLFNGKKGFMTEKDNISPLNVYAKTKAEAELAVSNIYPESILIRTNFYGWGTKYRYSFSDYIINSLRSNKKIKLFQDVVFNPVIVKVLAESIISLVKLKQSGLYHIVADDAISKYEFGLLLAERFSLDRALIRPAKLSDNQQLVIRPHDMSLSNSKLTGLLGKKLGSIKEHLEILYRQENCGMAKELFEL